MGTYWNAERIAKYEDATSLLNYPEVPLKHFFDNMIRPDDTVLEIGSGPGVVSLYLAPFCKSLVAIDDDKVACDHLRKTAAEKGINNIEVQNIQWPDEQVEPADITITLYAYKIFKTMDRVKEVLRLTGRAGMYMITQPGIKGGYPISLFEELGIDHEQQSCYNDGCRTAALLEAAGAKVHCEKVHHDFGQPVEDMDEAARFLMKQLKGKEEEFSNYRAAVEKVVEVREGRLYVPYKRTNCVVIYEK